MTMNGGGFGDCSRLGRGRGEREKLRRLLLLATEVMAADDMVVVTSPGEPVRGGREGREAEACAAEAGPCKGLFGAILGNGACVG